MDWGFHLESVEERRGTRGAVVIFLPDRLEKIVAPLREKYDPLYNLIGPHVSLVYPFHASCSLDDIVLAIEAVTTGRPPLKIELNSIGDFYPRTPKIFWNVKAGEELSELYFRLYTGLEQPIPFKQYQPHVTVAREISYHRVLLIKEKIVGYLPDESFEAEKIELISPLPNNRWGSVRTFPLSGPTPASGQ